MLPTSQHLLKYPSRQLADDVPKPQYFLNWDSEISSKFLFLKYLFFIKFKNLPRSENEINLQKSWSSEILELMFKIE